MPLDIAFRDSLNGVITFDITFGPSKGLLLTSDGGITWHPRVAGASQSGSRVTYQALSYFAPDFLLHGSNDPRKSTDSGRTWVAKGSYGTPLASRIIHSNLALALTSNGAKEIAIRRGEDRAEFWGSLQGERFEEQNGPNSGFIFDSSNTWAVFYTGRKDFIRSTSDGGNTWNLLMPIDTTGAGRVIYPLVRESLVPGRAIVLGGRMNEDDFLIGPLSGDGPWEMHSDFGGRAYRVQETAPGEIWAVIGKPWAPNWELYNLGMHLSAPPKFKLYADSLAHSTDGGMTWVIDGSTFEGDSIIEMYWVNRNLGFILTWSEGKSYVHRYSSTASVEQTRPIGKFMDLHISPNPARRSISYSADFSGEVALSLLSIDGQLVHDEQQAIKAGIVNTLQIPESMSAGNYVLLLRQGKKLVYQSFIKY